MNRSRVMALVLIGLEMQQNCAKKEANHAIGPAIIGNKQEYYRLIDQ